MYLLFCKYDGKVATASDVENRSAAVCRAALVVVPSSVCALNKITGIPCATTAMLQPHSRALLLSNSVDFR